MDFFFVFGAAVLVDVVASEVTTLEVVSLFFSTVAEAFLDEVFVFDDAAFGLAAGASV